ncbi:hypothetical protein [Streptomyces regalis]|uniref:hypothetical protein n=1 Tax=Streptomyces regalis TaxID=68262 RepID=UPI00131DE248|nr:hypothetical protein [Streptomyces regalis]
MWTLSSSQIAATAGTVGQASCGAWRKAVNSAAERRPRGLVPSTGGQVEDAKSVRRRLVPGRAPVTGAVQGPCGP